MSLEIIKQYKILAKKSLGQNFLIDEDILESIASIIDLLWRNIVEVGPWYWPLTQHLLYTTPNRLDLVELDKDMISILKKRVENKELEIEDVDFNIHNVDILKFHPEISPYSVIANIPYYITSPILRHFLYNVSRSPENMLILMQKDVWDKILGWKKNKTSVIRLFVEKKCRVEEKIFVPKESFYPAPKIESSVLLFETHNNFSDIDDIKFMEVVKKWFSEPRKKLIKNLLKWWYREDVIRKFFIENNLSDNTRGEDVDIGLWCKLVDKL